jgi:homocysteine S-methyltransferase
VSEDSYDLAANPPAAARPPAAAADGRAEPEKAREAVKDAGSEPAGFREKVQAGRFVMSVEVDPPHGLSARRAVQGASLLWEAGADAINVGDSPTAKIRMSPLAMSVLLKQQVGCDIVMHYTTRDRNAMAIHSDMVGAHVLGIHTVLCLRGDPPAVGGYTDIVGVWDVSAVGLMRFLKLMNDGVDFTGKSIGRQAAFFIGASANLNADPLEPELRLMRRKVEAGAHFFMTQNVFDEKVLERFLEGAKKFGRPIIVGVLPLHNSRHAEFLHNEVPGMYVPENVRAAMRKAGGEKGPVEGQRIAREFVALCKEKAAGVYFVPSFGRYDIVAELIADFR